MLFFWKFKDSPLKWIYLLRSMDKVMSVMVTGIIEEEFGESQLKAIYSYSLDSRSELENIMDFIDSTWSADSEPQDLPEGRGYNSIDDLLDGTGIELED